MSGVSWPRYPPCASGTCDHDPKCCGLGRKFRWPELVGKTVEEAKQVIERESPNTTTVIIQGGRVGPVDFCCNRVFLILDSSRKVFYVPTLG